MDQTRFDDDVRQTIYRLFVDGGRAPLASEVARELSVAPVEVEDAFRRLHEQHMLVLAPGTPYVWMANPFSALPTPYSVECGGKSFWGNCIWDSLGIIALLGSDGKVTSSCPDCAEELQVEVRAGEVNGGDYVVHYAVPARQWWDDIGFN